MSFLEFWTNICFRCQKPQNFGNNCRLASLTWIIVFEFRLLNLNNLIYNFRCAVSDFTFHCTRAEQCGMLSVALLHFRAAGSRFLHRPRSIPLSLPIHPLSSSWNFWLLPRRALIDKHVNYYKCHASLMLPLKLERYLLIVKDIEL